VQLHVGIWLIKTIEIRHKRHISKIQPGWILLEGITPNMYAYYAHSTHCTSICDYILVTHATNGSWGRIHGWI
jgi:hypothetical protein